MAEVVEGAKLPSSIPHCRNIGAPTGDFRAYCDLSQLRLSRCWTCRRTSKWHRD